MPCWRYWQPARRRRAKRGIDWILRTGARRWRMAPRVPASGESSWVTALAALIPGRTPSARRARWRPSSGCCGDSGKESPPLYRLRQWLLGRSASADAGTSRLAVDARRGGMGGPDGDGHAGAGKRSTGGALRAQRGASASTAGREFSAGAHVQRRRMESRRDAAPGVTMRRRIRKPPAWRCWRCAASGPAKWSSAFAWPARSWRNAFGRCAELAAARACARMAQLPQDYCSPDGGVPHRARNLARVLESSAAEPASQRVWMWMTRQSRRRE